MVVTARQGTLAATASVRIVLDFGLVAPGAPAGVSGARAARAAAQLRKAGYEKASAVTGGLAAWREAGLPVDKKPA